MVDHHQPPFASADSSARTLSFVGYGPSIDIGKLRPFERGMSRTITGQDTSGTVLGGRLVPSDLLKLGQKLWVVLGHKARHARVLDQLRHVARDDHQIEMVCTVRLFD